MPDPNVVHIEVHGQKYPIRTQLDPKYVTDLAEFVEARMSLAARSSPSSDAMGLAILTALNITDEYLRARSTLSNSSSAVTARAEAIEKIVDQALALAE